MMSRVFLLSSVLLVLAGAVRGEQAAVARSAAARITAKMQGDSVVKIVSPGLFETDVTKREGFVGSFYDLKNDPARKLDLDPVLSENGILCRGILMKQVTSLLLPLLLLPPFWQAQEETPPPMRVNYDMQLLVASRSGPGIEGRKLFAQRCAVCHIGTCTEKSYGTWLNRQRIEAIGEDEARELIMEGSPTMPGWKHTLQPSQVDQIITYLMTVNTTKKVEKLPTPLMSRDAMRQEDNVLKSRFAPCVVIAVAAGILPLPIHAVQAPTRSQGLASPMLTGRTLAADGQVLEGVAVSARMLDKTFTTTVYTDEQGTYVFPLLHGGKYQVWAQAVGYATNRVELKLDPGRRTRHEFTLSTMKDFTPQLSGTEWMAALPEDTLENRRMKEIFRNRCTECHPAGLILQNRFDEDGWRAILDVMDRVDYFGIVRPAEKPSATRASVTPLSLFGARSSTPYRKEELAVYLAKMRGPGDSPMKFKPYPRPRGDAARVVITEYDIPPAETPDSLNINDGSDWAEGTPSIEGFGAGVHDVHVDFDGNAWCSESAFNTGRTYTRINTKTGQVTGFKIPAPPDGRFARGSHGIIADPNGMIWFDVHAGAGLSGFGSFARVDPRTEKLDLFTPPKEMSTGAGRTLDYDGLGRIWASTGSGAIMFDPATKQFTHYRAITPGGAVASYGVAGDAEGNGWWTQSAQDLVCMADTKTGKVYEIRMRPRTELQELLTPEEREYSSEGRVTWVEQQYPRRLGADKNGNAVWVPNYLGGNLARIDTQTREVEYYQLPIDSNPYYTVVDRNHMVWTNLMTNDRVAKFDPETKEWTIYVLPSLGGETRNIAVDNRRDPVEIWVPYFRTSRIARLQFRTKEEIDAVNAVRGNYYSAQAGLGGIPLACRFGPACECAIHREAIRRGQERTAVL